MFVQYLTKMTHYSLLLGTLLVTPGLLYGMEDHERIKPVKNKLLELKKLVEKYHHSLNIQLTQAQTNYGDAVDKRNPTSIQRCAEVITDIEFQLKILRDNAVNERVALDAANERLILLDPQGNIINPIVKLISLSGAYYDCAGTLRSIIPEDKLLPYVNYFINKRMGVGSYPVTPAQCLLATSFNLRPEMTLRLLNDNTFKPYLRHGRYTVHQIIQMHLTGLHNERQRLGDLEQAGINVLYNKKINERSLAIFEYIDNAMAEIEHQEMCMKRELVQSFKVQSK